MSARSRNRTPWRCSTLKWTHGADPGNTPRRTRWSGRQRLGTFKGFKGAIKDLHVGEKAKWDVKHFKSSSYSSPADTFEEIYYQVIAKASRFNIPGALAIIMQSFRTRVRFLLPWFQEILMSDSIVSSMHWTKSVCIGNFIAKNTIN